MKTIASWLKQNGLILVVESKTNSVFHPHAFGIDNLHTQFFTARLEYKGVTGVHILRVTNTKGSEGTELVGTSEHEFEESIEMLFESMQAYDEFQLDGKMIPNPQFSEESVESFVEHVADKQI